MRQLTRRPDRISAPVIALTAFLSAALLFTVASVSAPSQALGANTFETRCDGVALRTKATTKSTRKAVLEAGVQAYAVTKVTGGSWRVTCGGKTTSGNTWYRISNVKGMSVSSRFGVTYVYAATALLRTATAYPKYTACSGVALRTQPKTSATRKAVLPVDTKVLAVARVSGGSWSVTCGGKSSSGNDWFRITTVKSYSVPSHFGVTYVYSAAGLYTTTPPSSTPAGTTPTPTPTPTPDATPTPAASLTEGIDVSHWQGTIDWTKVRNAGKRFVYMKASESQSFVDKKYATNRAAAKAAGLYVGAYHFAQPDSSSGDAAAEADHFIDTAKPVKGELIPVLDLEVTNGLSSTALVSWTKSFLKRVYDRTGVKAAIYVSPSFWSTKMGNTNWFAVNGYKVLWIAHWTTGSKPTVPADNWGGQGWTFWQYTSTGSVPGISGNVDLNRYNGTDFAKVRIP